MKIAFLILALAISAGAQPSNIHVAGTVGASANNTIVGVTVGGDVRKDRIVFSVDGGVVRAWKDPYPAGYQIEGRQTVRFYASERVFIQGGATETYHRFDRFTKISIAPLAGIGIASKDQKQLYGFNFRADLTSENRQRVFEGWTQVFGKRRIYVRAAGGVSNFIDGTHRTSSGFARIEVGAWWN